MTTIALYGGEKAKKTPFGTGRRFGEDEVAHLREALDQNTLFYWAGNKVKEFTAEFARLYGMKHCVATSSGTAAIHVALGTLGVTAGDEVITSPITDMGSVIGILYQNAIPIFADVDPYTYNMDPESIERSITEKTKAIVVVHLAGNPADMDPIMDIARRHGVRVVEDCAQSYMSYYKGRLAGTIGDIGCFSLNDFKHISAGDGGMLVMNDEETYLRAFRFADKNYDRFSNDPQAMRRIEFLAPNYRMNELTGAVGLAQLKRVESICARRASLGDRLSAGIDGLPGISIPKVIDDCVSSYWFYMLRLDENEAGVTREEFSRALDAEGVPNAPGYIPTCVYEYDIFLNRHAYEGTDCPFGCKHYGRTVDYRKGMCPNAEDVLNTAIRLKMSEFFADDDVDEMVDAIRKVSRHYAHQA